jgi:DNA-binding PadR family transcriptional regulator
VTPPVFAHGHLRLYLLSLLAASPAGMHGYELIQALGERFGGTYVPSAGTIYPRLAKLEEEGLVTKAADGRKTVYAITETGRSELAERESELDGIESDVTDSVRRLAEEVRSSVNDAMRTLRADLAAAAREARTESRATSQGVRIDVNSDGMGQRMQLQRADSALTDFRGAMRTALRVQAAQGDLRAEVVEQLVIGLDELRSSITAALKN